MPITSCFPRFVSYTELYLVYADKKFYTGITFYISKLFIFNFLLQNALWVIRKYKYNCKVKICKCF